MFETSKLVKLFGDCVLRNVLYQHFSGGNSGGGGGGGGGGEVIIPHDFISSCCLIK